MDKVVKGGQIFFKDDIQIIDTEIAAPLNLPNEIPIFSRDELQVFYNGHIFVATEEETPNALVKTYKRTYGLEEIELPKKQEDRYFSDNSSLIDKLKQDFIEKAMTGIEFVNGTQKGILNSHISSALVKKIIEEYESITKNMQYNPPPGKGTITENDDNSLFNSYIGGFERVLLVDSKIYSLLTMVEYISMFKKSFEKSLYKKIQNMALGSTPEKISNILTENSDKVHRKVLPAVRNRIWHSDRSFKLLLDGVYWVPVFNKIKLDSIVSDYKSLLERKIKLDSATEYVK